MNENTDFYTDSEGQLSFTETRETNYYPVAADYGKIPNLFIDRLGNISYLADLGLKAAIQVIEERTHEMYEGTEKGLYYQKLYLEMGTDFSEGLVAELPINKFISQYGLNSGGSTYNSLNRLYTGDQLRNQWQIFCETEEGRGGTTVLTGTWYSKKTGMLYMKFNPDLRSRIYEIQKDYALLSLPVLGKLKIEYISELYQRLKKTLDIEQSRNIKYGHHTPKEIKIDYELDYLYFMMGLYPIDLLSNNADMQRVVMCIKNHNYTSAAAIYRETNLLNEYARDKSRSNAIGNFGYFRRAFLDRAFAKINGFPPPKNLEKSDKKEFEQAQTEYEKLCHEKYPTDIHFRYCLIRSGVGGKVSGITFYVSKAKSKYSEPEIVQTTESKSDGLTFEKMEFLIGLKNIISEEMSPAELRNIADAADWDEDKIIQAYDVAKASKTPIANLEKFLIKAIKEEWTVTATKNSEISEELYPEDVIREECGFNKLHLTNPEYDRPAEQFITIIYDALNSDATKYKIGQSYMPAEIVKKRLLEMTAPVLEYAIRQFLNSSKDNGIISPAYILTILYNAHTQKELEGEREQFQNSKKTSTKNCGFTNFPQRDYSERDYEELERKKLMKNRE